MEKLVICAAITGGGPPRRHSPFQPVTPREIAAEALAAWKEGAAIVHCHARTDDGMPTNDVHVYRDLLARIRDSGCEAVVNFSAGDNGGRSSHEERLRVVDSGAEIVSLGGGSFNAGERLYDNAPGFRREMALRMRATGVVPEVELFDMGQLHGLQSLLAEQVLPARPLVTVVTGAPGVLPADPDILLALVRKLTAQAHWTICCQSPDWAARMQAMFVAYALGGHVRCGMEDHVHLRPGTLARSNAELVAQWVTTAAAWGRPLATPAEVRTMLNLPHGGPRDDSRVGAAA